VSTIHAPLSCKKFSTDTTEEVVERVSLKFDKRIVALSVAVTLMPLVASAHGVTRGDARVLQNLQGAAIGPLMYLGAKHMVTDPSRRATARQAR